MGATMEATLVLEALNRALAQRQIEPDQLLVHTDQGGGSTELPPTGSFWRATRSVAACRLSAAAGTTPWARVSSRPSNKSWISMTTPRSCCHLSSCKAVWRSGSTVTTTASVVTQRSVTSTRSLTSSSSSAPINSNVRGPETCTPNWGNPNPPAAMTMELQAKIRVQRPSGAYWSEGFNVSPLRQVRPIRKGNSWPMSDWFRRPYRCYTVKVCKSESWRCVRTSSHQHWFSFLAWSVAGVSPWAADQHGWSTPCPGCSSFAGNRADWRISDRS